MLSDTGASAGVSCVGPRERTRPDILLSRWTARNVSSQEQSRSKIQLEKTRLLAINNGKRFDGFICSIAHIKH